MCFIPFVATKTLPNLVPEFPHTPGTQLNPLNPQYAAVAEKFTLPHCAGLQIEKGCGCWLRYVDYPTTADMDYHVDMIVCRPNYNPANE